MNLAEGATCHAASQLDNQSDAGGRSVPSYPAARIRMIRSAQRRAAVGAIGIIGSTHLSLWVIEWLLQGFPWVLGLLKPLQITLFYLLPVYALALVAGLECDVWDLQAAHRRASLPPQQDHG